MCRIISVGNLDRSARDYVDSFGGDGIVADTPSERRSNEQHEEEPKWVKLTIKPVTHEGEGLW